MTSRDPTEQEILSAAGRATPSMSPMTVERYPVRSGKADVYRVGTARAGESLVLKLADSRTCALEDRIYREVLARLPVPSIRCHGAAPSHDASRAWLVMDHVEGSCFDQRASSHATSLARWVGAVHRSAAEVASPTDLPDHGPEYWRTVIVEARLTLSAGVDNPAVTEQERAGLLALMQVFDRLLSAWSGAARRMDAVPSTLTHGDLVPQNVLMGRDALGSRVPWVHDWGGAGWGCPMIDLLHVSLPAYRESLAAARPKLSLSEARVLRALGTVCWIAWVLIEEREALSSPWPGRAAAKVPGYLRGLPTRAVLSATGVTS